MRRMFTSRAMFVVLCVSAFLCTSLFARAQEKPVKGGAPASPAVAPAPATATVPASPAGAKKASVHVDRWLVLGPFPSPLPAFSTEDRETFGAAKLLAYEETRLSGARPAEGDALAGLYGQKAVWRSVAADTNGVSLARDAKVPAIAYLAAYLDAPQWTKASVTVHGAGAYAVTIDGAEVVKNEKGGSFKDAKSADAKLERGKHLLLVKMVHMPSDTTEGWRLDASVSNSGTGAPLPDVSTAPGRNLSLNEILYVQNITGVAISPDGSLIAITTGKYSRADEKYVSWVEIRGFEDGSLVKTIKDVTGMSNVRWAPTGKRLSYVVSGDKDTGSLRVLDLDTGACSTVIENVKNLGRYVWNRDGRSIVYTVTEKAEPDKRGVKHVMSLEDRSSEGSDRSYLYVTTVPGGETRRLTSGPYDTFVYDTDPDGTHVLISRDYEDLSQRPYTTKELVLISLADQSAELLWKGPWLQDAEFSAASFYAGGKKILIQGGPSAFGAIGVKVSEGTIPNDYDGQLYIFDIATKSVEALTRDFDPAVMGATWSKVDGNIYLTAEDRSYSGLFRCNPQKKTFDRISTGFEAVQAGAVATEKLRAAYVGSGATQPPRLYAIDLARGTSRMIYDPAADDFKGVVQGTVQEWGFTTSSGTKIDGYFYLPPGFDPQKKYPCIVYYYGGTSPTTRLYGGRYPKNLWAARGYVVYVLQPSGATGFGQQFSALHVNDWGKIVAGEIIEGTKKFVEAHPFVDAKRLGCIGASYGGFMTELLLTKTDMFAAAVSHAGISDISGYWGEGYSGYAYNAVSAANSFPWNRRDIYVDQSALYSADKIHTPLLLLHGAVDTNVPPGQSEELFTALKLLGRTVELVRVEGQNHAIMDYKKRDIWSKTIMAWFDRFLKDEPDWWNDLYPPGPGAASATAQKGTAPEEHAAVMEPAKIGVKVLHKKDGSKVLLGEVTRDIIVTNIAGWDEEYFPYQPDASVVGELSGRLEGIKLVVVLGTWCSDSHREVPRLWKVLDAVGFLPENMKAFAVEHAKAAPDSALTQDLIDWSKNVRDYYGIKAVESIIVYRNGAELGRIVEAPANSIEADLLEILKR